jgi:hypothetical protein
MIECAAYRYLPNSLVHVFVPFPFSASSFVSPVSLHIDAEWGRGESRFSPVQIWWVLRGWLSSGISFCELNTCLCYSAGIQVYESARWKEVRSLGWRRTWLGSLPGWFASILHCVIKLSPFMFFPAACSFSLLSQYAKGRRLRWRQHGSDTGPLRIGTAQLLKNMVLALFSI